VRKVGPRGGTDRDATQIFRRGLPFFEVKDNQVIHGLQFVSFQASRDQFDAVYGRWMLNADFPRQGTGQDALVARGLINVERWGFFFVPPDSDDPIGTIMLKPGPETRKTKTGRVAVRKELLHAAGNPSRRPRRLHLPDHHAGRTPGRRVVHHKLASARALGRDRRR